MRWAVALVMLLGAASAAAAGDVLKLAGTRKYHERFDAQTPVHGGVVLGLQVKLDRRALDPRSLVVYAPPAAAGEDLLCVEVITSSGRYWSRNPYDLGPGLGWAPLETNSSYARELERFKAPAFAVRAELRKKSPAVDGCGQPVEPRPVLLIAGLGSPANWPVPVTVLVNSKGTSVSAKLAGQDSAPQRCRRIDDVLARAYDVACDLSLPGPGKGRLGLELSFADPGGPPDVHQVVILVP
jgi:hypothetical protein